jgi:hypothetical protein
MLTRWTSEHRVSKPGARHCPNFTALLSCGMATNEHTVLSGPQEIDLELGTGEVSNARTPPRIWHQPCHSCSCETDYPLRQPPPLRIREEHLPQYKSLASAKMTVLSEKLRHSLPPKKHGRLMRNIRWKWFLVYHRLHLVVLLPNLLSMIILGAKGKLLTLPTTDMALAVAVNITAAVLIRQELVINMLFAIFGKCPHWVPLRIRRLAAKIYHLGGLHSGAAIAATVWYTVLNAAILKGYLQAYDVAGWKDRLPIAIVTFVVDVLLIGIIVLALPQLRAKFHNTFEVVHRFAGWIAVALFWAQLFLLADAQRKRQIPMPSLGALVYQSPLLYLLIIITICLILPWLRLRKVSVVAEPLSSHAVRLHFSYTNLPLCAAPRFSHSPLKEWHAFAGIPEADGIGFSIIVSKAGDWTGRLISSPPKSIWVRGIPARGVLHIAPIFKSMVLVATGSGIGPILSLLTARGINCRIIWSTKDPVRTYRQRIVDDVLIADSEAIIINTHGGKARPDLIQEAHALYRDSNAEAVFVISNPAVTRKVVFGLESRGVPTFAPIFDS